MPYAVLRSPQAPRFVGRQDELDALTAALAAPPSVVFVEGEAGIGKTRLVHEALGRAPAGRRALLGSCLPLREPFPYGPVVDLFRGLGDALPAPLNPVCGALRAHVPELAAALPPAPEPPTDHRAAQHRLFRAVRALLEALGETVVVVEDVHWADDGTRDLLRFLADAPPPGLSLLLTYRREDLPGDGGLPLGRAHRCPPGTTEVRVPLLPLGPAAVRELAAAMAEGADITDELAAELHRRTAGIPFVLEETVRALAARGARGRALDTDTLEAMPVPALLQEATADRLAQLSPDAAEAVRAAAVLRVPAEEELLAAMLDDAPHTDPHPDHRPGPPRGAGCAHPADGTPAPARDPSLGNASRPALPGDAAPRTHLPRPALPGPGPSRTDGSRTDGTFADDSLADLLGADVLGAGPGHPYRPAPVRALAPSRTDPGTDPASGQQPSRGRRPGPGRSPRPGSPTGTDPDAGADGPGVRGPGGGGRAVAAVREALLAGMLHEQDEGRYGFRHALAQQAVYAMLPGPDRHQLHRRALTALARRDPPPLVRLAYHARMSGDWRAWYRHCEQAAEAAHDMGDTALAVELLEELLSDDRMPADERGRLAARLSREAAVGLAHRRATGLLRRVLRDARLPAGLRGEIRLNLGLLLNNQAGRYQEGRADTETAVAELHERPALAARGMAALAMPGWGDQPRSTHEKWIARAEELVAGETDGALRLAVRGNHLALLMSCGSPAVWRQAETLLAQGGTVAERRQVARACGNLADAATCLGHYAAARRYRREGRRLAVEYGAPYLENIVEGTALRLAWYTGRWDGLAERARAALGVVRGVSSVAADAHLVLGLLASARGEWEEAEARLRDAGLADPANAPANILAAASAAMARLRTACGDPEAGCAEALRAVARIRRKDIWTWAADLAPMAVAALVRCSRHEEAEALTAEFGEQLAGRDAPLAAAAHLACQGVLATAAGRGAEAAATFTAARAAYAVLPQPYSAARAGEAAARNRLAFGDAAAAAQLAAAAEEFGALGAVRDAARCRSVLRRSGTATPSRRGRRGYGGRLSPREGEVARLVSLGRTNREIAEVLFLSPRTVEQHVARVLRKLNLTSRSQVPAHHPAFGAAGPAGDHPGA